MGQVQGKEFSRVVTGGTAEFRPGQTFEQEIARRLSEGATIASAVDALNRSAVVIRRQQGA